MTLGTIISNKNKKLSIDKNTMATVEQYIRNMADSELNSIKHITSNIGIKMKYDLNLGLEIPPYFETAFSNVKTIQDRLVEELGFEAKKEAYVIFDVSEGKRAVKATLKRRDGNRAFLHNGLLVNEEAPHNIGGIGTWNAWESGMDVGKKRLERLYPLTYEGVEQVIAHIGI